jgi:hypothetical protein
MTVSQVFAGAGPVEYELSPQQDCAKTFRRLWEKASHFALVRHGPRRVTAEDAKARTAEFVALQGAIQPFRSCADLAIWVSSWPGTQSQERGVLWLRCRVTLNPPIALTTDSLWQGVDGWDDLQLLTDDALLLYVCSHESFGSAWSRSGELPELTPAVRRTDAKFRELAGERLDPELWNALKRGPEAPDR